MKTYAEILASRAARARKYRATHPERKREQNARYYANHRETCIEASTNYAKRNRKYKTIQHKERISGLPVTPIRELRTRD